MDTATTASLEGAATTVYANGGRGNTRLIAWEGEKTLTFSVTDALLSPIGFSILSGAGLFGNAQKETPVHVHMTTQTTISGEDGALEIDLTNALSSTESIDGEAPIFVAVTDADGSLTGDILDGATASGKKITGFSGGKSGDTVFVDYYITKAASTVDEMQIDMEHFGGYFYVEADTLFRRQSDGVDLPAVLTLPNVKIQSNFTFSMASTGDPSTFQFTMDAFPGYTLFDNTKKVLCVLQVVNDTEASVETGGTTVMS